MRHKAYVLKLKADREGEHWQDWQARAASSKVGKKRPEQAEVMKKLHRDGKLPKTPKSIAKMKSSLKEWHKNNEHPKGFEGRKHTQKARQKIGESSRRSWQDENSALNSEERSKKLSESMSKQQATPSRMRTRYSRGKQGKRQDLGGLYVRSSWEANYARYLNWQKDKGIIKDWQYEPDIFWFEGIKKGTRHYTPDFKVFGGKGEFFYVEVKGWMDQKSRTKLKRMEKYHPDVDVRIVSAKEYREIARRFKPMINEWE